MFSFLEKKKRSIEEDASGRNLHVANDDDSFATRSSRTVGFFDEPAAVVQEEEEEEVDYSTRHSRSFLDAVNFDDDDASIVDASGGLSEKEVENMTDSEREARFKVAEFAELTDSQREDRVNFLNESLMAQEGATPGLGDDSDSNQETNGLLAGGNKYPLHSNLMMEEGITMNLLDASDRYQDNYVMDATKLALQKTRCSRYSRIGSVFLFLVVILAVGSIVIVDQVEKRYDNNMGTTTSTPNGKIDTPSIDPGEFYELYDKNKKPFTPSVGNYGDYDDGKSSQNNQSDMHGNHQSDNQNNQSNYQNQNSHHQQPHTNFVPTTSCTDNPNFLHNGEYGQNCIWVSMMDTVARCTRQGVKENCRATCDPSCSVPTSFPTEYPTGVPTDSDRYTNIVGGAMLEPQSESPKDDFLYTQGPTTDGPTFLPTFFPTVMASGPTTFPTEQPTKFDENAMGFR